MTGTKLASLDNTPLYFRAVSVSIPPGQKISFSARPNGILYQLSGFTEVNQEPWDMAITNIHVTFVDIIQDTRSSHEYSL